jgi:alpha-tubulin suppressor-like RCC1 family protein
VDCDSRGTASEPRAAVKIAAMARRAQQHSGGVTAALAVLLVVLSLAGPGASAAPPPAPARLGSAPPVPAQLAPARRALAPLALAPPAPRAPSVPAPLALAPLAPAPPALAPPAQHAPASPVPAPLALAPHARAPLALAPPAPLALAPLALAAGADHTCALLPGGSVDCWGSNVEGQVGVGSLTGPRRCNGSPCAAVPLPVRGLTAAATAIAAGDAHTCALLAGGAVACWGSNADGQLGDGDADGPQHCGAAPCATAAVMVRGIANATALSAGGDHTCALLAGGSVACWGSNAAGQLGDKSTTGPQRCAGSPCATAAVTVRGIADATAVSAGGDHTCAVLTGGAVVCWGANQFGQLGDGRSDGPQRCGGTACSTAPVAVRGIAGATALAAGAHHTCALLAAGTVDCWGYNFSAQLGIGTSSGVRLCSGGEWCSTTAVAVSGLANATALSAGADHTCALLAGGTVECWGFNSFGALGDGLSGGPQTCYFNLVRCAKTPVAVLGLGPVGAVAAGGDHTCAVLEGGGAACWGADWFGELGAGARPPAGRCNFYPCSAAPVAVEFPVAAAGGGTRR